MTLDNKLPPPGRLGEPGHGIKICISQVDAGFLRREPIGLVHRLTPSNHHLIRLEHQSTATSGLTVWESADMIKDPPLLTVKRNVCRPDKQLLKRFAGVPTSYVVDAMGGRGGLDFEIRPLVDDGGGRMSTFVGPALTCHSGRSSFGTKPGSVSPLPLNLAFNPSV